MGKTIKKIQDFKQGGYYSFVRYSPQGSPSYPRLFYVIEITKNEHIITKRADGEDEEFSLSELARSLALEYTNYSLSRKKDFVKQLNETILEKKNKVKIMQQNVKSLQKFILTIS